LATKKNCLLHHDNAHSYTLFITREFLAKNNMAPETFYVSRHFYAIEAIEAESHTVPKITEHDFLKTKLRGLSPRANYTNRVTAEQTPRP
jgi:hypothetical protein